MAFAFAGAGLFNAIGGAAVQAEFMRWRYPAWWNFVTAAFEGLAAALIVLPETRIWGLALGAMVLIAAIATAPWRSGRQTFAAGLGAGGAHWRRIGVCGRALNSAAGVRFRHKSTRS